MLPSVEQSQGEIQPVSKYGALEQVETPCGNLVVTSGMEECSAEYPPKIPTFYFLGELNDEMKPIYPRGNGRSFTIRGNVYHVFGTTIWKDAKGQIVGEVANSLALVSDPELNPIANVAVSVNRGMAPFLPLTETERELEKDQNCKVVLEMPGGLCKPDPDAIGGYMWLQKYIQTRSTQGTVESTFQGVSLAIAVGNKRTDEVRAERIMRDKLLFTNSEPAFGSFCSVLESYYFYAWGKLGEDTYLARVEKYEPENRSAYEYWDGYGFTQNILAAVPVFSGYSSGTIMRSKMFGHLYNWVFIGGTESNTPVVTVGVARDIQGPYIMYGLIKSEDIHPMLRQVHSVYAHQWANDERNGQLLVTWNERNGGNIVGVKLQFAMLHEGAYWKDISFVNMPSAISSMIMGGVELIKSFAQVKKAACRIENDKEGEAIIRVFAEDKNAVNAAVDSICNLIRRWCRELLEEGRTPKASTLKGMLRWPFYIFTSPPLQPE
ncbi:hypothetical protein MGYG_02787 [Nannizzia gypsea CBS 118893]|uniref:Uncharacterized protein n=1 Tax=Arthroderma gypseum (strain ATCC MYA-4604 / CBS 118893) TaxID=535722 RepID=E4UP21_ARTGP|nr:hypothetical protein MGYG_02787 [Nannizzia gypsea CBS 118893]EFQ99774.1 hypothetical protein MGYG_02787 [Nannizzia gypsea CBS 118893]